MFLGGIERDECHEMDLKCFSNYKDSHSLYGCSQQNFHQNVLDSTEAREFYCVIVFMNFLSQYV